MTWLFDWLVHFLYQIAGYITSFLTFLYNYLFQLLVYLFATVCEWVLYSLSWLIVFAVYAFDLFLQCIVYIVHSIFGGDLFGTVGLSVSLIEDNMSTILSVAPYAKMCAYVLNLDAFSGAIQCLITFLLIWVVYRWLRVWLRG